MRSRHCLHDDTLFPVAAGGLGEEAGTVLVRIHGSVLTALLLPLTCGDKPARLYHNR